MAAEKNSPCFARRWLGDGGWVSVTVDGGGWVSATVDGCGCASVTD